MTDSSVQLKNEIRQKNLIRRKQIDKQARSLASQKAAEIFFASELFQKSQNVACYLASEYEFATLPLIKIIIQAHKNCYLPRLSAHKKNFLEFVRYSENDILIKNRYQILEPCESKEIALERLDVVIFPLVAFDYQGHRLGMGGGYYDRTFAAFKNKPHKPIFLGLGYDEQAVQGLPADEWDVTLDGILTEKALILISA